MKATTPKADDARLFWMTMIGALIVLGIGFLLAWLMKTPLDAQIGSTPLGIAKGLGLGVVATLPLIAMLWAFAVTSWRPVARFRQSQVEFLNTIGFELTPMRMVLIALAAGISEEVLFRGVLQTWLTENWVLAGAIIAPNIIFGLLHARTFAYAAIAAILGVYLGLVFWWTGDLLVPITAHGLYDLAALYAARALGERNQPAI